VEILADVFLANSQYWLNAVQQDFKNELLKLSYSKIFIGYSGGVDSTVLLYLACQSIGAENVTAVHVNHDMSINAQDWQNHCQEEVQALGCHFLALSGSVKGKGSGLEAAARELRYQKFTEALPADSILLLGHHLDDQVETFFLRLMRGAGLHGLKSMARISNRAQYKIYRPILDLTRQQIEELAREMELTWIEDESNLQTQFDRNFLRHDVLPMFESRWPAYRERIQSVINLLDEPEQVTKVDIAHELEHRLSHDGGLKLVQMDELSQSQVVSLMHAWLTSIGQQVPSTARLEAIVTDVIGARSDAMPEVKIGDGFIRRHGPALYWVECRPVPSAPPSVIFDKKQQWEGVGSVCLTSIDTGVERLSAELPELNWRLRSGNECMKPFGRSKSRDLKRLLQEYRVKPWLRNRIPLLFSADELIAVGDILISDDHRANENEEGFNVFWQNNEIPD